MESKIRVSAMCVVVRNGDEILAGLGYDNVKDQHFGRLPGGGVDFGETSEVAIRREFMEELNAEIKNVAFIQVVENIFIFNGKPGHEVIFVYTATFTDKNLYKNERMAILDKDGTEVTWIKLSDVTSGKLKLYPEIDYEEIVNLPAN